jgi:hypothetical protein
MDERDPSAKAKTSRKHRCLQVAHWLGAIAGCAIGLLHLYWLAVDAAAAGEPIWKVLVTAVPATLISAYVGSKTTAWAARRTIAGNPTLWQAGLKGLLFGAIDGAAILTVSYIPFFIAGHYLGILHFNLLGEEWLIPKLVGASIMGGMLYGGLVGAMVGVTGGLVVGFYIRE